MSHQNQHKKHKNSSGHPHKKDEVIDEKQNLIDNYKEMKEKLLSSKIGLINAGGSCYMASIIQILIHLEKFLDVFLNDKCKVGFSNKFFIFLQHLAKAKYDIEIKNLADEYNRINNKFNGEEGNNPMTFFTEFIKELSKENKEILNLFKGEKEVHFDDIKNYIEQFLFYLVILDKNNNNITVLINQGRIYDDAKEGKHNPILLERIRKSPEILIINLEIENIKYEGEEDIVVEKDNYKLVAVNRYSDYHSIA